METTNGWAIRRIRGLIDRIDIAINVKHHGQYSHARVHSLQEYSNTTYRWKVMAVITLTPILSLISISAFEFIQLEPPSSGLHENHSFFVRQFLSYYVLCLTLLQQFTSQAGPALPISTGVIAGISLFISSTNVGYTYILATLIGFPVPFVMQMTSPSYLLLEILATGVFWCGIIRGNPSTIRDIARGCTFNLSEWFMILVYPIFFYLFNLVPPEGMLRIALFCVLPVFKVINRQFFHRVARRSNGGDALIPALIVFNVDVMGNLFVAFCMQSPQSVVMAAGISVIKVVYASLTLWELWILGSELTCFRRRIHKRRRSLPISHPESNLLDDIVAIIERYQLNGATLLDFRSEKEFEMRDHSSLILTRRVQAKLKALFGSRNRVSPKPGPSACSTRESKPVYDYWVDSSSLLEIGNAPPPLLSYQMTMALMRVPVRPGMSEIEHLERCYVAFVTNMLYAIEFVILVEYVEVIVPILYSLYLAIMFHMPNRVYYAQFASMDEILLRQTVGNMLFYTIVEVLSLIIVQVTCKRLLHISPIRILSFVLTREVAHVQAGLLLWIMFAMQASLKHYGNDYSFQFAWLKSENATKP